MALRRSRVRIPLGPQYDQYIKSQPGVVGHPASEMGERGESPSRRLRSATLRPNSPGTRKGDCVGESSSQRR